MNQRPCLVVAFRVDCLHVTEGFLYHFSVGPGARRTEKISCVARLFLVQRGKGIICCTHLANALRIEKEYNKNKQGSPFQILKVGMHFTQPGTICCAKDECCFSKRLPMFYDGYLWVVDFLVQS